MSDPVAEAAAALAAQQAEPGMLEKALDTIHDLEAKVEHLIHPDAAGNVSDSSTGTLPESTLSADSGPKADLPNDALAVAESTTDTASAPSASGSGETSSVGAGSGEDPNAGGTTATATVDSAEIATPTSNSASQQGGQSTTLDLAQASSRMIDSPLHVRIAAHLEAIYSLAKMAPVAAVADTSVLKTHVGDILHRISNGMAVTEGELVQKLEALYRML